jgi:hypothetical protein
MNFFIYPRILLVILLVSFVLSHLTCSVIRILQTVGRTPLTWDQPRRKAATYIQDNHTPMPWVGEDIS